MSDDLRRVEILRAGRKAEREIGPARTAAQTAWNAWRSYGTYKTLEGHVTSTVTMPFIRTMKPGSASPENPAGIMAEIQTDGEHPEHARLKALAEAADRHVIELDDAIADMKALERR
jgi:hypothetical protein